MIALLLLALALAGCLPGQPPGPKATATPRPTATATPTATPTPLRIILPTSAPQRSGTARPPASPPPTATVAPTPTPTVTPRPTPTATTPPPPELRGAGSLLYLGTLGGRKGIVATEADGSNRRLIAEGTYLDLSWAPDGRRFAALLALGDLAVANRLPDVLDLFTADGQRVRRFDFGSSGWIVQPARWSPDSVHVAATAIGEQPGSTIPRTTIAAWILDESGAVAISRGHETWAEGWSPAGELLLRTSDPGVPTPTVQNRREALWLADATGDARKLLDGGYRPLGWSPDGTLLYALGDLRSIFDADRGINESGWLSLVAIERASGAHRVVASADGATPGGRTEPPTHWFRERGSVSPGGDRIATWVSALPPEQGMPTARPPSLLVFNASGALLWSDQAPARPLLPSPGWSPDGWQLAYVGASGTVTVATFGTAPVTARALGTADPDRGALQWSPDGRWLAFNRTGRGLILADSNAPSLEWVLDDGGSTPRWRPIRAE